MLPSLPHHTLSDLYAAYGIRSREGLLSTPLFVEQYLKGGVPAHLVDDLIHTDAPNLPIADPFTQHATSVLLRMLAAPDSINMESPDVHASADPSNPVACPPYALRRYLALQIDATLGARSSRDPKRGLIPKDACWLDRDGVVRTATLPPSGRITTPYRIALHAALLRGIPYPALRRLLVDDPAFAPNTLQGARAIHAYLTTRAQLALPTATPEPTTSLIYTLRLGLYAANWLTLSDAPAAIASTCGSSFSLARIANTTSLTDLHAYAAPILASMRMAAHEPGEHCTLPSPLTAAADPNGFAALTAQARGDAALLLSLVKSAGVGNEERAARKFFRLLSERIHGTPGTVVTIVSPAVAAALMWYWVWVSPLLNVPTFAAAPPVAVRAAADNVAAMLFDLGVSDGTYNDAMMRASLALAHAPLYDASLPSRP